MWKKYYTMTKISKAIFDRHPDWRDKFWQFVRFRSCWHCILGYSLRSVLSGFTGCKRQYLFYGRLCRRIYLQLFPDYLFTFRSKPSSRNAVGFGFSHLINYLLEIGLLNLFLWIGAGELLRDTGDDNCSTYQFPNSSFRLYLQREKIILLNLFHLIHKKKRLL